MKRQKLLDQVLLLAVALSVISGLFWLIRFMDHRGISERTGFFISANVFLSFILTWNAIVSFGRTPRFWAYHAIWMSIHAAIAVGWAYSGAWMELCVVVLPFEAFMYYKVMKHRLHRLGNLTSALSPGPQQ